MRVIVDAIGALITDSLTRSVRRGAGRHAATRTGAPAEGLDPEVVDRHVSCAPVSRYSSALDPYRVPNRRRRGFQIACEVRQLFDLRGEHCRFDDPLFGDLQRSARTACEQAARRVATARALPAYEFAVADQTRGVLRGATVLAARAPQDQGVAAVLHDRLRARAVNRRHLGN